MAKVHLAYEFDLHKDADSFRIQSMAIDWWSCLQKVDAEMRTAYKHDDQVNKHCSELIERWRGMIAETGAMDL